jgi:uncharacterized protein (TIGR02588 family)
VSSRPPRSPAEWASFAGSSAVIGIVVALIGLQVPGSDRPAAPIARVEQVRHVGDAFHVDVTVHNDGDDTAANVEVAAELTVADSTSTGEQTIDFLSGGEDHRLVFVFGQSPELGELRVDVTGFAEP